MYVVYRKSHGQPRSPMGHFKAETAAKAYAEGVYRAFPSDEVIIADEPDGERKNFVDAPDRQAVTETAPTGPELTIERAAKGAK
jgi:hypothetical protein